MTLEMGGDLLDRREMLWANSSVGHGEGWRHSRGL